MCLIRVQNKNYWLFFPTWYFRNVCTLLETVSVIAQIFFTSTVFVVVLLVAINSSDNVFEVQVFKDKFMEIF